MKVTCIKIARLANVVGAVDRDGWLTVGKQYIVLEVYGRGPLIKYRIVGDDGGLAALHNADQFELSSPEIPNGWVFRMHGTSEWQLAPAAFADDGFWVSYFDGEGVAEEIFKSVLSRLKM